MESFTYIVEKIDGDYAVLRQIDITEGDTILVTGGSRLYWKSYLR